MDGFNVIPVDKGGFKGGVVPNPGSNSAPVLSPIDTSFEIVDEEQQAALDRKANGVSWFFVLSIVTLIGTLGYFVFLVIYRVSMLQEVGAYSVELRNIRNNIDLKEMKEFQDMDTSLKAINGRLSKHALNSRIMRVVNSSIRNTLQVSEYRIDTKEKNVEVNLTAVAPSFKELAEQTEKFYDLKSQGIIQSFAVSSLNFENETRRMKFSVRLIFDKNKVTAASVNAQAAAQAAQAQQNAPESGAQTQ